MTRNCRYMTQNFFIISMITSLVLFSQALSPHRSSWHGPFAAFLAHPEIAEKIDSAFGYDCLELGKSGTTYRLFWNFTSFLT
ncbi:hypothetical protein F5887DRAFT_434074 [Amanita rubescens]|nr:hypothetical protein F5887DRAFT_434074 [Amanita rubescens]